MLHFVHTVTAGFDLKFVPHFGAIIELFRYLTYINLSVYTTSLRFLEINTNPLLLLNNTVLYISGIITRLKLNEKQ